MLLCLTPVRKWWSFLPRVCRGENHLVLKQRTASPCPGYASTHDAFHAFPVLPWHDILFHLLQFWKSPFFTEILKLAVSAACTMTQKLLRSFRHSSLPPYVRPSVLAAYSFLPNIKLHRKERPPVKHNQVKSSAGSNNEFLTPFWAIGVQSDMLDIQNLKD